MVGFEPPFTPKEQHEKAGLCYQRISEAVTGLPKNEKEVSAKDSNAQNV